MHPLVVYDADPADVLFLNARRGKQRIEYLSYSTGRHLERPSWVSEQRELLAHVLDLPVDDKQVVRWAEHSQAEQQQIECATAVPAVETLRRLGEFELLSELGRGGMGVVYRAWQPSLGRHVAVKKLFQLGDPKAEARFAREIRALGRVDHPNLVKIFTSGTDADQWFYAMELIDGATLSAVIENIQSNVCSVDELDLTTWKEALATICA